MNSDYLVIQTEIQEALWENKPIVALESTMLIKYFAIRDRFLKLNKSKTHPIMYPGTIETIGNKMTAMIEPKRS